MQYSYCTHSFSTNTGAFLVSNRLVYCYYRHIGPGGSAIKIDSEMVFGDSFGLTEFFPLFPSLSICQERLHMGASTVFKMQRVVGSPQT